MGNPIMDGRAPVESDSAPITAFYTPAAWIEGRAEDQLKHVAGWSGVKRVVAFPDLHPGKYGPVGCAVLADRIYPQLIGNDIGCGMSLFALDLPMRKLKLDKAARKLRVLGDAPDPVGNDAWAHALGTIGGGNHFCEVQKLVDAGPTGLDPALTYLLVHSGSRGFGNAVLDAVPQGSFAGLDPECDAGKRYIVDHDKAVLWASLNRQRIAERAALALRAEVTLITDVPHNILTAEDGLWLHRKGAAVAQTGLVPLAGSRATPSYLLRPTGHADALASLAHGAGRRYDRSSMHGRVRGKRSDLAALERNAFGGRIICEDKDMLIEEAPLAYKSSEVVLADLIATGAATQVATFHPVITFKKTRKGAG